MSFLPGAGGTDLPLAPGFSYLTVEAADPPEDWRCAEHWVTRPRVIPLRSRRPTPPPSTPPPHMRKRDDQTVQLEENQTVQEDHTVQLEENQTVQEEETVQLEEHPLEQEDHTVQLEENHTVFVPQTPPELLAPQEGPDSATEDDATEPDSATGEPDSAARAEPVPASRLRADGPAGPPPASPAPE